MNPQNLITEPLEVIKKIIAAKSQEEIERGGDFGIPKIFADTLKLDSPPNNSYRGHIPSLNNGLTYLSHGSLVRFRCMVQNTFEPEYHLNFYTEINQTTGEKTVMLGKYQDDPILSANCEMEDSYDLPSERAVVDCVEIPGESTWVKQTFALCDRMALPLALPKKTTSSLQNTANTGTKRKNADDMMDDSIRPSVQPRIHTNTEDIASSTSADTTAAPSTVNNTPITNNPSSASSESVVALAPPSLSCVVKFYDDMAPNMKIGHVMEVTGILNISATEDASDGLFDIARVAPGSSSLHAFRIHAVHVTHLSRALFTQETSAVSETTKTQDTTAATAPSVFTTSQPNAFTPAMQQLLLTQRDALLQSRQNILQSLQEMLCGDAVAAYAVFLHFFIQVIGRQYDKPVEHLTIGISDLKHGEFPATIASNITQFMQALLPKVRLVPVTISALNSQKWGPEEDSESGILTPGILQVSDGTSLVMDETSMNEGQLQPNAIQNIRTFIHLQENSKLQYIFPFTQPLEFPVDTPALILSSEKPLLPCDLRVPLMPPADADKHSTLASWIAERDETLEPEDKKTNMWWNNDGLAASQVDRARQYVFVAKSMQNRFHLSDTSVEFIQKALMARLAADRQRCTQEVLHIFMTVARLVAISYLKEDIDEQVWTETCNFVDIVLKRVEQVQTKPAATN